MDRKRIAILGSTGSIGSQTLDVVREHPERFEVVMISANSSAESLVAQAREFNVPKVVICSAEKYPFVRDSLPASQVFEGIDSACDLVGEDDVDIVVAAMVGFSGLRPTLAAIRAGKTIALANKETLVAAGSIVMAEARSRGVDILPVDSEHSAIFQCLAASNGNPVHKIHLTASGGPFRSWNKEEIATAKSSSALKHPNWSMGAKITIDSATMMNKGFEVIEARWLFDVPVEKIHVVVHPESVIHSMAEFEDGAIVAQLGSPDMRVPIALALSWPERLPLNVKKVDFGSLGSLSFEEPDLDKFPCLRLAMEAIRRGGNAPCALNSANEAAVAAYLKDQIAFYDIPAIVSEVISRTEFVENPSLDEVFATDKRARDLAERLIW